MVPLGGGLREQAYEMINTTSLSMGKLKTFSEISAGCAPSFLAYFESEGKGYVLKVVLYFVFRPVNLVLIYS